MNKAGLNAVALILALALVPGASLHASGKKGDEKLQVETAHVDFTSDPAVLYLTGTGFDLGGAMPAVTLGGMPLAVSAYDTATLTAELPVSLPAGDYSLKIIASSSDNGFSEYDLTIGAIGPQGEQGEAGPAGVDGTSCSVSQDVNGATITCGQTVAQISNGLDGAPGPRGEPGPPGPPGLPGAPGADGQDGSDGTSCSVTQGTGSAEINCTDGSSATILDGPQGPAGDGLQASDFYVRTATLQIPNGLSFVDLRCLEGDKPIGANASLFYQLTSSAYVSGALAATRVYASHPSFETSTAHSVFNNSNDSYPYQFYAICIDQDAPRANPANRLTAQCTSTTATGLDGVTVTSFQCGAQ